MDAARECTVGSVVIYQPIGHRGIHHYQLAHGFNLRGWERRAVLAMDQERLTHLNRDREDDVVEAQPVTPSLMKALFG